MKNNNLTTDQLQQLLDIGTKINQIRIAKNISLDTVAANTLISQRLLEAIEAGDIQELPEPFYIQALVSKFAQEIGAKEIQFEFESELDSKLTSTSPQKNSQGFWLNFQLRSLHLYLLYIFLVIVSVKGITTLVERPVIINQTPPQSSAANPEVAPGESKTTDKVNQPKTIPQFVSQSNNSDAVSVGINLQERCWLKVMVDGKLAFEGVLPEGTQRQWTGRREVTIKAGNAGGVVINFNNEQQKVLGAPGQVEEITYTVN
ncbi:MAG: RodZ domain-containing protein [Waterburya sp.]